MIKIKLLAFFKKQHAKRVMVTLAAFMVITMSLYLKFADSAPDMGSLWHPEPMADERGYILSVLKDHKTGLSILEESTLADVIIEESEKHGLDPIFVMALIKTESTFYNWAKSNKGAVGLMQVLPGTGKEVAGKLRIGWEGERTLYDPYINVRLGISYFAYLKDRFGEDTLRALAAYN
ncbi:MAG: lytic transglycosylase domain-containing protein, partial [Deltaproteobacteria bacterium]|nr:lytic transglycosylase domain-containing protein [Deltaproteobacteria bacterium]